jgi:hypothetical protein
MLLRWKKDNLKYVPLVATTPEAKKVMAKVKNTSITLLPGMNEVSQEEWEVMKPHIQDNLDDGSLEEIKEKTLTSPGKPQKDVTSIIDLAPKKAAAFIKETNNPETLNLWLAIENRDEIRRRISDRIKELELDEKIPDIDLEDETVGFETGKGKRNSKKGLDED